MESVLKLARKKPKGDSKFFTSNKKGSEISTLRTELASTNKELKKTAVKKIIAGMTIGVDFQELFVDVLNNIQTDDLELKKMVYLYVINYADSQPELALLAVSTFTNDAAHRNPLIRALAVRTMGCIRVQKICEYLFEPLRNSIRDEDPYVRKTAAVCVAKLYDIEPTLVEEQGFIEDLRELISDSNPTVVSNAVAALSEIQDLNPGKDVMLITSSVLKKLVAAMNECTEWGQIFILDSLAKYNPESGREAEEIIERVVPRLNHSNSAIVLSAVKVIMNYMEYIENSDTVRTYQRKIGPPLITLLSAENPEIQYVALRNINVIVQKRPSILSHEIKVFFCKYNDPIYVKLEKLEIMVRLSSERNIEQLLNEFTEYAQEVDVTFVRKSVRAIGHCAIKLNRNAAERCIKKLLELINGKVNYVVQETVVVIRDIFRKYPNRYESIIAPLCENLDTLDEPEAKSAMIWIIGEYAERMDNADELLERFVDTFADETDDVQLALLTAVVKVFLKNPSETKGMVQSLLKEVTSNTDNPDLRDRGFFYWRLLSSDAESAKEVVLAEKPEIGDESYIANDDLLDKLVKNLSSLAVIYGKDPQSFVPVTKVHAEREDEDDNDSDGDSGSSSDSESDSDEDSDDGDDDEEDNDDDDEPSNSGNSEDDDILGLGFVSPPPAPGLVKISLPPLCRGDDGVEVYGKFIRQHGNPCLQLIFTNKTSSPMTGVNIRFNKNLFGLKPVVTNAIIVSPGGTGEVIVPCTYDKSMYNVNSGGTAVIEAAIQNAASKQVYRFTLKANFEAFLSEGGRLVGAIFVNAWKNIHSDMELKSTFLNLKIFQFEPINELFTANNIFLVAKRDVAEDQTVLYFSAKADLGGMMYVELKLKPGVNAVEITVKSEKKGMGQLIGSAIKSLLS